MDQRWCFQCGAAYVADVSDCLECGVGLVDEQPTSVDDLSEQGVEQLAYELHEWSFESRRMVDQLLTARGLVHSWQGASLLVLELDEEPVDALIEEVERATLPTLDPALDHVVYEMGEWTADNQSRLVEALGLAGVPNQFDAHGDLVVHAEDEDEVDRLVDEVTAAIAAGEPEDVIELDGLGTNELLSRVFVSVDKLRRNPHEAEAVVAFDEDAAVLARIRTPFGLDSRDWAQIVGLVDGLAELYQRDLGDFDEDHARALAAAVRNELVRLI
ncbi:MAG: hypothetical protein OES57_12335 [Acidimicrobiia bacterium]|nr:hypothetical protein [Acidimicrobiia bacterium]